MRCGAIARLLLLAGVVARAVAAHAAEELAVYRLPPLDVVDATPVHATGLDARGFPAAIRTLEGEQLDPLGAPGLPEALDRALGAAALVDAQGNPFQAAVQLRGFTASPVLGEPQGIAVYQDGIRWNEPFGDVVLWDLVPTFAIARAQVIPGSHPMFGWNALGGAISLRAKTGFDLAGVASEVSGGSFGRADAVAEAGGRRGTAAFYGGLRGFREDGWRDRSPSRLGQAYGSVAWRDATLDAALTATLAASELNGNGAAPLALLQRDRDAVFTVPDRTENRGAMVAATVGGGPSPALGWRVRAWVRHVRQERVNGDAADFEPCERAASGDVLCAETGTDEEEVLVDRGGRPVPASVGGDGILNRSDTVTLAAGTSAETTFAGSLWRRPARAVLGGSFDGGRVRFDAEGEVGALDASRTAVGSGLLLGGDEFTTRLTTTNLSGGLFALGSWEAAEALTLTAAARLNVAAVRLHDRAGSALDGDHTFVRADPSVGLAWRLGPDVDLHVRYAEASRLPTAAELACADPDRPCRFPNAFVADPPLDPVVARTVEVGLRGRYAARRGRLAWSIAGYGARNADDIVFVSSGSLAGSGYFRNAGTTQRLGVDLEAEGRVGPLEVRLGYGYVRATFEDALTILNPNHPAAAADGTIDVRPGDRLPNVPEHTAKLALDWHATERWSLGTAWRAASSRTLRGDESNQLRPLDGFVVGDLTTTYRFGPRLEATLQLANVTDARYETFGVIGDPREVLPGVDGVRFATPGAPRALWAGVRVRF
jgi:outer membrane receptor protein involved in Fe transport